MRLTSRAIRHLAFFFKYRMMSTNILMAFSGSEKAPGGGVGIFGLL